MKTIIYDIEIFAAIPGKEARVPGVIYCQGWKDFAGMGISCICAYDYSEGRYRVFTRGNFKAFKDLCDASDLIVGFNSIPFDNSVVREFLQYDIPEKKSYDLLREIWIANGMSQDFQYPSHTGYGLDAMCDLNFGLKKTGNGATAPVDWQQGKYGEVIDYCINDVRMTKALFTSAREGFPIKNPKGGELLLRKPKAVI